jgi:DNA-binding MarR family transcriptional regulator
MGIFKHLQNEIEERDKREGITMAELLDLSPPLRRLMNRITRHGELSLSHAAVELGEPREETQTMLNSLVEKGYLLREKQDAEWIYRTRFARKRGTSLPPGIWSAIIPRTRDQEEDDGEA